MMEAPGFYYPEMPQSVFKKDETGRELEIKPNESKLFMWK